MYDIEQFLREAGAERINEKAIISLERELRNTVKEIVEEASLYANYAGRKKKIKMSDVELADGSKPKRGHIRYVRKRVRARQKHGRKRISVPRIGIVDNLPVVEHVQQIALQ